MSRIVRPSGSGAGEPLDDAAGQQRAVDGDGPAYVLPLRLRVVVVLGQQPAHRGDRVAGPGDDVEQRGVGDGELRGERLRFRADEPVVRRFAPRHEALGRLLAHDLSALARVVAGLGERLLVLDDVLGRLHDDPAGVVEAGPSGAAGDLVELAHLEVAGPHAVVLAQPGEHHGADRHVDADAEGVGAADDLEQPGLRERLDEPAVLRQHPGVVYADAVTDQAGQRLAEPGGEPEVADELGDPVLLGAGADVDAHQRLSPLDRGLLGEVHDVDRRLAAGEQVLDGLLQRGEDVGVVQRDGPLGRAHQRGRAPGALREVLREEADVAESG